jgi:hypothetical protein
MQRRFALHAFVLGAVFFNAHVLLPPAAFGAQTSGCKLQIAKAGQSVTSLGAVVSDVVLGINESPHNPFPGKESITFRLGSLSATKAAAKKSSDLMNSPAIQAQITKQLFNACTDVVEVRFNMTATDWDSSIFRGEDGSIIKGTCVDPGRGNDWPLWGYYPCL